MGRIWWTGLKEKKCGKTEKRRECWRRKEAGKRVQAEWGALSSFSCPLVWGRGTGGCRMRESVFSSCCLNRNPISALSRLHIGFSCWSLVNIKSTQPHMLKAKCINVSKTLSLHIPSTYTVNIISTMFCWLFFETSICFST